MWTLAVQAPSGSRPGPAEPEIVSSRWRANDGVCGSYPSKPDRTITSGLPNSGLMVWWLTLTFYWKRFILP